MRKAILETLLATLATPSLAATADLLRIRETDKSTIAEFLVTSAQDDTTQLSFNCVWTDDKSQKIATKNRRIEVQPGGRAAMVTRLKGHGVGSVKCEAI